MTVSVDSDLNASAGGGTPGGADTQVQFNDGGVFNGDAGLVYNKTTNVLTNVGGYLVSPQYRQSGGYSAANPQFCDSTNAAGMSCSTTGAFFVVSSVAYVAFSSDGLIVNGSSQIGFTSGAADAAANDAYCMRAAAANIRQGGAASATPVAQTTSVQNASGTDTAGAARTYIASLGTGAGTPGTHVFQTGATLGTGTTLQTATTRFTIAETRLTAAVPIVLPSYVAASLPTGAAGMRAFCTDANATTFASIVAGGGANGVPVYHDGTNWRIG